MPKPLLLAGLLSLFAGAALAQVPDSNLESENFKQKLRNQYLRNDTAQAIINLYSRRQVGGASWLVSTGLAVARIAITPTSQTTVNGIVVEEQSSVAPALLVGAIFGGYGASKLVRFGNSKLEQTLTAYAAGQLPTSTRRRLKPRFFNQPIIQYQTIKSTPAK